MTITWLASSPGHSPPRVAWYSLFAHARNIPGFYGIRKITNIYRTLSTYTNRICSFYIVDRQRRLYLEQVYKALSFAVSKAGKERDRTEAGATTGCTSHIRRERCLFVAPNNIWQIHLPWGVTVSPWLQVGEVWKQHCNRGISPGVSDGGSSR